MQTVQDLPSQASWPTEAHRQHLAQLLRIWRNEGPAALRARLDELETAAPEPQHPAQD